jgi:hypothetical protein
VALQGQFVEAIRARRWVGPEARDAALCVQLIETAYASARADSKQLPIGAERAAVVKAG